MKEPMYNILKMTDSKTKEFVILYQKEKVLWDTTSDHYRNRVERQKAQDCIVQALNIPNFKRKHVIAKFKNLRNSYCQELRKIAEAEKMGKDHKPKVCWFALMNSFLRPHIRDLISVVNGPRQLDADSSNSSDIKLKEEEENWVFSTDGSESTQDHISEDWSIASSSGNLLEPVAKKPRTDPDTDPLGIRPNAPNHQHSSKDYYDDFGRYIASLLRSLPAEKALALQPKIVKLIATSAFTDSD